MHANNYPNNFMKYGSSTTTTHQARMATRPMSFDMHSYNFFNGIRSSSKNDVAIDQGYNRQPTFDRHYPAGPHNHHRNRALDEPYYDQPHHSLRREPIKLKSSTTRQNSRPVAAPINLDDLSDDSFSEEDEIEEFEFYDDLTSSTSHNAFCSTSDMTTSDSEIYRDAKFRYLDEVNKRKMMKKRSAAVSLESKFPALSPIYKQDASISSENEEEEDDGAFDEDDEFLSRQPTTPSRMPKSLEMIQEISPVLPESDVQTEEELPPVLKPLAFNKEWRPIQTSTMTSFHPVRMPKTNPHLNSAASTPHHATRRRLLQPVIDNPYEEPRSLFDPYYVDMGSAKKNVPKPKHFGLPSQISKMLGVKGILYLEIYIIGRLLEVKIKNAVYFLEHRISSFVKLELKRNMKRARSKSRGQKRTRHPRKFPSDRTITIPHNNRPIFEQTFKFKLSEGHLKEHDMLGLNVYSTKSSPMGTTENSLIGCMSFHLRRLFKKASLTTNHIFDDDSCEPILVGNGGYFLLDETNGAHQNLPEMKVSHRKYYDEIGSSMSIGSSSLNSSPSKIIGETEWRAPMHFSSQALYSDQRVHPDRDVLTRLAISPYKSKKADSTRIDKDDLASLKRNSYKNSGKMAPCPTASTSESYNRVEKINTLDYTSSSSSSGLGVEYKRHYRFTLPSITTSDTTGSEISNDCPSRNGAIVDYNYLYADPKVPQVSSSSTQSTGSSAENNNKSSKDKENHGNGHGHHHNHHNNDDEKFVRPVRRVQSFATERDTLTKRKQQERKKSNFGAIGRTFHYLKHKIDSAMSTSTLCPSHDEVRQWGENFEALINHKLGVIYFRDFLKNEYSEENILFWCEVEEFKKMKPGIKAQKTAHRIYEEFIKEQAPNEVNLDSGTKAATKAALEDGAKPDTFNLAQGRIYNLMAKDSYPRFLKSPFYTKLLNPETDQHRMSQASIVSVDPATYNCESKRGSTASDTGTMTVCLETPKPVVLVE